MLKSKRLTQLLQISALTATLVLTGCSHKRPMTALQKLESLNQTQVLSPYANKTTSELRIEALKQTALSLSAQEALFVCSKQINGRLQANELTLDRVFNFNVLILNDSILPPVLSEGNDAVHLADSQSLRLADKVYRIIHQAHFISTAPTWRDYLWLNYQKPEKPDPSLLPRNKIERKAWIHYIRIGWESGVNQTNAIFSENLSRLIRDYQGMLLYKKLLAQHIVSAPFVAKANLGITGGGNDMRVNDQVLRITALPALQPNSETWRPALTPEEDEAMKDRGAFILQQLEKEQKIIYEKLKSSGPRASVYAK